MKAGSPVGNQWNPLPSSLILGIPNIFQDDFDFLPVGNVTSRYGRGCCGVHDVEGENKPQAAPELEAMGKEQFIRNLESIRALLVEPGLILRFSATRPLTADMSGHSVTLLLELSLQDPSCHSWY